MWHMKRGSYLHDKNCQGTLIGNDNVQKNAYSIYVNKEKAKIKNMHTFIRKYFGRIFRY